MLILGFGSNIGDKLNNLRCAYQFVRQFVGYIDLSSTIWETEPWGYVSHNTFFNTVCVIEKPLVSVFLLPDIIEQIEKNLGRIKQQSSTYEDRIIDIDILDFDNLIIETNHLTLPHPKLHLRKFVLFPLKEIMPTWKHPLLKAGIEELIRQCPDTTIVHNTGYAVL
ncbi:MAG: 2-amino-4-hydroxy-6-hydroxymethyldihydropteridine diphosphokinase [Bacteroidales bacterium]|nr:2-amino-4-hydroxy-6-hydroxymethyldihydropteridine diphosphokinase [Bacteroidales bacterium]